MLVSATILGVTIVILGTIPVVSGARMLMYGPVHVSASICTFVYIVQGHAPQVFFGKYIPMIAI